MSRERREAASVLRGIPVLALCLLVGSLSCSDSTAPSNLQGPSNLWRPDPASLPATGNYAVIMSDQGDWIGGGISKVYKAPKDTVLVFRSFEEGRVSFQAASMVDDSDFFTGDFIGPSAMNPITIGYFSGLQRWPFHDLSKGGLSVGASSRGCNTVSGWFTVDKVSFSGPEREITSLDLRFEQRCDGAVAALHGAIHWTR